MLGLARNFGSGIISTTSASSINSLGLARNFGSGIMETVAQSIAEPLGLARNFGSGIIVRLSLGGRERPKSLFHS